MKNKSLISAIAKSVLAPNRTILSIIIICLLVTFFWVGSIWHTNAYCTGYKIDRVLNIGGKNFQTELATTPESHAKGLSGRSCIGQNQAMLFVFSDVNRHCFWMKNMRFDIDILWLNGQNQITKIEQNASFKSYPKTFCPDKPDTKNVLELSAGLVRQLGLKTNQMINL